MSAPTIDSETADAIRDLLELANAGRERTMLTDEELEALRAEVARKLIPLITRRTAVGP